MKLNVGKRILMFFHWLLSLLGVAALAGYLVVPDFLKGWYDKLVGAIGERYVKIIGIALLAVYLILALLQVWMIFKRRKRSERGFITVDSSDSGKVRIAISAIEQMVRQSVGNIDGLTDMKIGIDNLDDAIGIGVKASIVSGSHVPTITMNMQRAIRQFVETNCGVAVRTVSISIHSVTNQSEAPKRRRGNGQPTPIVRPTDAYNTVPQTPPAPVQEPDDDDEPAYEASPVEAPEPVQNGEPAQEVPTPVFEAPATVSTPDPVPAFDINKPYESEFAKDLAAMKAREAAQAAEAEETAEASDDRDEA